MNNMINDKIEPIIFLSKKNMLVEKIQASIIYFKLVIDRSYVKSD